MSERTATVDNVAARRLPSLPTKIGAAEFVAQDDGRLIVYPGGIASGGFVVPDADRERALRTAAERSRVFGDCFAGVSYFLAIPAVAGFVILAASHLILAYCFLIGAVSIPILIFLGLRHRIFRPLLHGLARAGPRDCSGARLRRRIAIVVLAFPAVGALAEYCYSLRIAALPHLGDETRFYPDVIVPIFVIYLSAGFLAGLLSKRLSAQVSEARIVFCRVVFGLVAFIGFIWSFSLFAQPTPRLTLSPAELTCGGVTGGKPRWHVAWGDIGSLKIGWAGKGERNLVATLNNAAIGVPQRLSRLICEISGLTVDYQTIYDVVQREWQARRS